MKRIGIVSAMDDEIKFLISKLDFYEEEVINNFTFYKSVLSLNDKKVELVISKSGIGKTAAGMLLATLNNNFKVDAVINTGICGGRLNHSNLGDVIVMDKCFYGDFSIAEISACAFGQIPGMPLAYESPEWLKKYAHGAIIGDLLTTDRFVTSFEGTEALVKEYFSSYNVCGYDMESAAFAHACQFFNIPFIAIRATSDVVGVSSSDDYNENEVDLCKVSSEYLYGYLLRIVNDL